MLADFRVYLNTFFLKFYVHCKLNMLGLILTTTDVTLMLVDTYLQKCVQYTGVYFNPCEEQGNMFKGLLVYDSRSENLCISGYLVSLYATSDCIAWADLEHRFMSMTSFQLN